MSIDKRSKKTARAAVATDDKGKSSDKWRIDVDRGEPPVDGSIQFKSPGQTCSPMEIDSPEKASKDPKETEVQVVTSSSTLSVGTCASQATKAAASTLEPVCLATATIKTVPSTSISKTEAASQSLLLSTTSTNETKSVEKMDKS